MLCRDVPCTSEQKVTNCYFVVYEHIWLKQKNKHGFLPWEPYCPRAWASKTGQANSKTVRKFGLKQGCSYTLIPVHACRRNSKCSHNRFRNARRHWGKVTWRLQHWVWLGLLCIYVAESQVLFCPGWCQCGDGLDPGKHLNVWLDLSTVVALLESTLLEHLKLCFKSLCWIGVFVQFSWSIKIF